MFNRKAFKRLGKVMVAQGMGPRGQTAAIDYKIAFRADLAAAVLPHVVNGELGILRSGMDCDCSRYSGGSVMRFTSLVALAKAEDDHQYWLDGPESVAYVHPDVARGTPHESRDLAMEAYEDGHPHVVYA